MKKLAFYFCRIMAMQPLGRDMFLSMMVAYTLGIGNRAYNKGDFKKSYEILKPIVDYELKDPYLGSAQYIMGLLLYYGKGVTKNVELGEAYILKAAEQGNEEALIAKEKLQ